MAAFPNYLAYPVLSFPVAATAASQNILSTSCLLVGFSFIESSGGAPAVFNIIDGNDVNGEVVAVVGLDPGQSIRDLISDPGLLVETGPFLQVVSGSVRGSIWYRHIPRRFIELDRLDEQPTG